MDDVDDDDAVTRSSLEAADVVGLVSLMAPLVSLSSCAASDAVHAAAVTPCALPPTPTAQSSHPSQFFCGAWCPRRTIDLVADAFEQLKAQGRSFAPRAAHARGK